jgi:mRNA interferase HigB
MRVIAVSTLKSFWLKHPDAEQPLKAWVDEVRVANWQSPVEVKVQFRSASILKGGRIVFNIAGNKFRLAVDVAYRTQIIFVKFLGTHEEYDRIDVQSVTFRTGGKK